MSRLFADVRVSTNGRTTDNQIGEIRAAGFEVQIRRVVSETVSGSLAARERKGFRKLLDRMEEGDILVVTKMDRLGRNAMDVRATVEWLCRKAAKAVRAFPLKAADDGDRGMSLAFKGRHFAPDIILLCLRWYCRYALSYRDLEEMMTERGLSVDHTTIYRWVQHYAPELDRRVQRCRNRNSRS